MLTDSHTTFAENIIMFADLTYFCHKNVDWLSLVSEKTKVFRHNLIR